MLTESATPSIVADTAFAPLSGIRSPKVGVAGVAREKQSRSLLTILAYCLLPLYIIPALAFFVACVAIRDVAHFAIRVIRLLGIGRRSKLQVALAVAASFQLAGTSSVWAARYIEQVVRYHNPAAGDATMVWGVGDEWKRPPSDQWPAGTFVFQHHMNTPMSRTADGWFEVTLRLRPDARVGMVFYSHSRHDGSRICEVWDSIPPGQKNGNYTIRATGEPISLEGNPEVLAGTKPAASAWEAGGLLAAGVIGVALIALALRLVPFERYSYAPTIAIAVMIALGLALRLAWVLHQNTQLGNGPQRLVSDETGYHLLAVQLLRGEYFIWPGRMPLYPTFLAGCYLLFGDQEAFSQVALVQAVLSSTVVLLTYVLARWYVGVRGALLAALLMAILPSQIEPTYRLMSEALFGPLLLGSIVLLVWAFRHPDIMRFTLAGMAIGVTSLCRPNGAYLFVILALVPLVCRGWPLRRRFLLPVAYVAGLALVLAPWTLHNWHTFHRFMPLTVPGSTVWQGSPEYYRMIRDDGRSLVGAFDEELNPRKNGGHNIFSIEGSDYFTRRGVESILAEPKTYAKYSVLKAMYFWVGSPHADWPRLKMFDPYEWTTFASAGLIAAKFASRLFPFVALAALAWLAYCRQFKPAWLLLAVLGYFTLFHALLYAEVRYSEPLQPVLAVFIGMACAAWLDGRAGFAALADASHWRGSSAKPAENWATVAHLPAAALRRSPRSSSSSRASSSATSPTSRSASHGP